ncbi:MAG: hypothetical protein RIG84_17820 [Roseovarius sp.]
MGFKSLCAALLGVLLATGAQAQTVEFRGGGVLVSQSNICDQYNWGRAGEHTYANFRFRPAGVGDNSPDERLTVFFNYYAMSLGVSGKLNKVFKNAQSVYIGSIAYEAQTTARVKVTSRQPATISGTTDWVRLVGEIRNFDDLQGCTMTFEASLFKRP